MDRLEKKQYCQLLKDSMQQNESFFIVKYQGLNVASLFSLRNVLREQEGAFRVAKVTLVRRAVQDANVDDSVNHFLSGQIGLVFAKKSSSVIAKILQTFAKDHEGFIVQGGYFQEQVLSAQLVNDLANLPSKDQLIGQVVYLLGHSVMQFNFIYEMIIRKLLWSVEEVSKKKVDRN